MKYTTHYNLSKPDLTDVADIEILNGNMDIMSLILFNINKDKVDKVVGKGLSTNDFTTVLKNKLDGIAEGANKYTHPDSHSLDIITETTAKKIMTNLERAKLEGIEIGATKYNHPANHPASMITESTTKKFTSDTEKAKWNKTSTDLALTDAEVLANKTNLGTHLANYTHQLGTAELETTDKTLKGAINETFTLGNSRKQELVDMLLSLDDGLLIDYENTWEEIYLSASDLSTGVKTASGIATISSKTKNFTLSTGTNQQNNYITIDTSILGFTPSLIVVRDVSKVTLYPITWFKDDFYVDTNLNRFANTRMDNSYRVPYSSETLDLPMSYNSVTNTWVAYE